MTVYGELKLVVSNRLKSIKKSNEKINDFNIVGIKVMTMTADGRIHTLKVHDYEIDWQNDED